MSLKPNGAAIRAIRERTGISLVGLASAAGINKGYLSRIERGERVTVGPEVLRALADRLGVPLEAIISYPAPAETAAAS
jgi:transcriptional regulator with XRE-family HTH domain